jgi:hypothetical protein
MSAAPLRFGARLLAACSLLFALLAAPAALAQAPKDSVLRPALLEWDLDDKLLYFNMNFRDVLDGSLRAKLSRGLPTTIVLTAAIYRAGQTDPVSTATQTCKVTWHVWEEAFRVELLRPGTSQVRWTTTLEGVLRRCAEARRLLAGDANQIRPDERYLTAGKVQVNPVSPEVLQKLRRWVMRPSSTGTAAPGDALFSTFTGLFLQRVGDAERELRFATAPAVPSKFRSKEPPP